MRQFILNFNDSKTLWTKQGKKNFDSIDVKLFLQKVKVRALTYVGSVTYMNPSSDLSFPDLKIFSSELEPFYTAVYLRVVNALFPFDAMLGRWFDVPMWPFIISLQSSIITIIALVAISFSYFYLYPSFFNINSFFAKVSNVFFVILRWAYNYLLVNTFKAVWGYLFRNLMIVTMASIFLSNLIGLASITYLATGHFSVTFSFALLTFLSFNFASVFFFEVNWFKVLLPYNLDTLPSYPVVYLELASYALRVVSLAVRLFANITSGHLLLSVLAGILWAIGVYNIIATFFVWSVFSLILLIVTAMEAFISFLQGFVFLILLKIYSDDCLKLITKLKDEVLIHYETFKNKIESFFILPLVLYLPSKSTKETTKGTQKTKAATKKEAKTDKATTKKEAKTDKATTKKEAKTDKATTKKKARTDKTTTKKGAETNKTVTKSKKVAKPSKLKNGAPASVTNIGAVSRVHSGVIDIQGLDNLFVGEIVYLGKNLEQAIVLNLEPNVARAAVFQSDSVAVVGTPVFRTFGLMRFEITPNLLGNVVDCFGNILNTIDASEGLHLNVKNSISRTVDIKAPGIIERQSITEPLVTGILSIDTVLPVGRGQRELIVGDRQLGKTSLVMDSIISQRRLHRSPYRVLPPVYCIYVSVGQKLSSLARIVYQLKAHNAFNYTIVFSATAAEAASLQYLIPYVATATAEWFMHRRGHVLIVYDDLGVQAVAYRQISLLLRRPPGREAYPGDIFYLHSRLLERSTKLNKAHGHGSITSLPIIETKDGDMSTYIPTNVISITDGQIFLSAAVFFKGLQPAVSFTRSVSRVGSNAQTKCFKLLVAPLKRLLTIYEEMKHFETVDAGELTKRIRRVLKAGYHLMTIFKQKRYTAYMPHEELVLLWAALNSFNFVSRSKSSEFKTYLVRSMAFDSWNVATLLNIGINVTTSFLNIFGLLQLYYQEKCLIYNSISADHEL